MVLIIKRASFLEGFEKKSDDSFLQAIVNETGLKSDLESMQVTFQSKIDTMSSQTDLQTQLVSKTFVQYVANIYEVRMYLVMLNTYHIKVS